MLIHEIIRGYGKKLSGRVVKDTASLFDPSHNSTYGPRDLARKIIEICKDNSSAEQQANPSPDVILRRLHQIDESEFMNVMKSLNEYLLQHIDLPVNSKIAVDFHTLPYYGDEQPSLVSDSRLPGTNLGIRFVVLSAVERRKTFTLRVRQVHPLESEVSILREMLDYAERLFDPKVVLLDRGFYSIEVIKELESRNLDFITPAKRTSPIKRLCKQFKDGNVSERIDYTVKSQDSTADVNLVFTKRKTKKGTEIHPFVTSLDMGSKDISKLYRWRWRIETNNREFKKFRGFTTSPSMKIRRIYFSLSMILYNFWIVVRGGKERPRGYEFKRILEGTLLEVLKELERRSRPPPPPISY